MAGGVICRYITALLAAAGAAGLSGAAAAEILKDPTRPAAAVMPPDQPEQGGPSSLALQSVIIMAPGRAYAVINGETVRLGGMYRDARLVKITETGVVLQSSGGTETLKLSPGIELTPRVPRSRR